MCKMKKILSLVMAAAMVTSLSACSGTSSNDANEKTNQKETSQSEEIQDKMTETEVNQSENTEQAYIEEILNLDNNEEQTWTYDKNADAWVLSIVSAVAYPELPDQQGVSVCVPGAYVKGIDTNGDGNADVTGESATEGVKGSLVIDYETTVTSMNGQVYTAETDPVVINTGAAGYGSQNNQLAGTSHAADGYINVTCGNRGKQDSATDADGNTYYTGDAPSCLVDQKAAARYVKYNILLGNLPGNAAGEMVVGTPDAGTTQSATGGTDSVNYATYEEMVEAYQEDIAEIEAGDKYGNNIVELYNPLNYIGAEDTENPTWVKILMGAAEGDISMFNSINLQIALLNAGIDTNIEWQWNGGHVPSETLGDSFSLYVDQMYGEYVDGAVAIEKKEATKQTTNGTATEATGTDISAWVNYEDVSDVSIALSDIAAYRTNGASKAMPGFDVIDYGQEDYVFGNSEKNARHWNSYLLEIFEKYADTLSPLFNEQ